MNINYFIKKWERIGKTEKEKIAGIEAILDRDKRIIKEAQKRFEDKKQGRVK